MNFYTNLYRGLAALFFIFSIAITAGAQNMGASGAGAAQNRVVGRVVEGPDAVAVEYASVVLKNAKDSVIAGTVTNKRGVFIFNVKGKGKHTLQISFIGYKTMEQEILIKPGINGIKEPIVLAQHSATLKEAAVTASYTEKQSDIERTRINTSASIGATTGSVIELLRSASMVSVDNNNAIYIRGNPNILVLMDGIPTTIGTLDGIPASATQSIEIITNPSAKFDSEGTGGIINIITKKEKRAGTSFSSTLNWGVANKVNGNLMAAFNRNGWNLSLNYSGKYQIEDIESELYRHFHTTGNFIEQKIFSERVDKSSMIGASASKLFNSGNSLSLNMKYSNPRLDNIQDINNINSSLQDYNSQKRVNEFNFNRKMAEVIANYKIVLKPEKSDLSLLGSYSQNKGRRRAYYLEDELPLQRSQGGGRPTNYTVQADYTLKLPKQSILETGIKYFYRRNDFKFDSYQYDNESDIWSYNEFFSSDLDYKENIYSLYVNYAAKLQNEISYKIGFRGEQSNSNLDIRKEGVQIKNNHLFLSPFALLQKEFSKSSSLAFSLSRRVTRPMYRQLNPFVNMIDKSVFEIGNRDLVPEEVTLSELAYNYSSNGRTFNFSLFYNVTNNFITEVTSLYDQEALMITFVNGDKSIKIGADLNLRNKFSTWLAASLSANAYYGETKGEANGIDLFSSKIMWQGNVAANITPSKKSDISLQYFYSSPAVYPQFESQAVHYMDASYKRVLIKNILTASITLTDVFNTRKWNIVSDNIIYSLDNRSKNESRVLWVGLSFNLNKKQLSKPQKKEPSQAQESLIKLGY
ncbi:MAG: TonB-dependent receptor [Bacteroidales bacterium]|nr:TonB-dependent receptor [Bacteroidales bacterium]MDD4655921.1 TonB-dependent receptor [Bacteroidales bacterium]